MRTGEPSKRQGRQDEETKGERRQEIQILRCAENDTIQRHSLEGVILSDSEESVPFSPRLCASCVLCGSIRLYLASLACLAVQSTSLPARTTPGDAFYHLVSGRDGGVSCGALADRWGVRWAIRIPPRQTSAQQDTTAQRRAHRRRRGTA